LHFVADQEYRIVRKVLNLAIWKKNITSRKILEDFESFPHPLQENTRNTSDKKALLTFSNDCISTYFATHFILFIGTTPLF
jgi:hypothetical protein